MAVAVAPSINRQPNSISHHFKNIPSKKIAFLLFSTMAGGGCKKTAISHKSSYTSLYRNPLIDHKHHRSSSYGGVPPGAHAPPDLPDDDKENAGKTHCDGKANAKRPILKEMSNGNLRIKENEPDSVIPIWNSVYSEKSNSVNVWDYSDSEAAPASSWSTLPNRSLMCRPLPLDVGRCTCIIVKESSPDGGTLYTLYTNEGKGRQNRKLAVAHHRRRRGRSEFTIAQNARGIVTKSDDNLIGILTSNIMGSKYHIWDQGRCLKSLNKPPKLLASVKFTPTVSTCTGTYRSIKAWIPRHQSMQLKNTNQIQHINGLPTEWEANKDRVHQLFSKAPSYSNFSKQYELDFREKGRAGLKIRSSVKNFQLTLERNGKQTILQLGRLGKSKYVMDYRYPLTGYQAFSMCLASIDSKLCCIV